MSRDTDKKKKHCPSPKILGDTYAYIRRCVYTRAFEDVRKSFFDSSREDRLLLFRLMSRPRAETRRKLRTVENSVPPPLEFSNYTLHLYIARVALSPPLPSPYVSSARPSRTIDRPALNFALDFVDFRSDHHRSRGDSLNSLRFARLTVLYA